MKSLAPFGKAFIETLGSASDVDDLGGKGAHLAEMSRLGLPVPSGVTIPTQCCRDYLMDKTGITATGTFDTLAGQVAAYLHELETLRGPCLYSVRSGAKVSMPGMMDTVLNVGMTESTLPYWKDTLGERAALDGYRRMLQMIGDVVFGIPKAEFERYIISVKKSLHGLSKPPESDSEMTVKHLNQLIKYYQRLYEKKHVSMDAISSLPKQLALCIVAVFNSWDNDRAKSYRKIHNISDSLGTAVTVQQMVFGNLNDNSCSGVLFTRNPATGEPGVVGEFLPNAQGEDVVNGSRTPIQLHEMANWAPQVYKELLGYAEQMELYYHDMQDMEFTVENGKLYILQTRSGKRSAEASFRIAVDLVEEGKITKETALKRLRRSDLEGFGETTIHPSFTKEPDLIGIPAGGTVVTGKAVLSSGKALVPTEPVILVSHETTPDDIDGMYAAVGILTATGGATSHAAVVARGMNKACVVGCTGLVVGVDGLIVISDKGTTVHDDGVQITIDGSTGRVWIGVDVPVVVSGHNPYLDKLTDWVFDLGGYAESLELGSPTTVKAGRTYVITTVASAPEGFVERLVALDEEISEIDCTVLLDLRDACKFREEEDLVLWELFSADTKSDAYKGEALIATELPNLTSKAVILDSSDFAIHALKTIGFRTLPRITTIAELLSHDKKSLVILTDEFISGVGGLPVMFKLRALFDLAGVPIKEAPTAVERKKALVDFVGRQA